MPLHARSPKRQPPAGKENRPAPHQRHRKLGALRSSNRRADKGNMLETEYNTLKDRLEVLKSTSIRGVEPRPVGGAAPAWPAGRESAGPPRPTSSLWRSTYDKQFAALLGRRRV